MGNLEHVQRRAGDPQPRRGPLRLGRFVAQQLEQAVNPAAAQCRAQQHRHQLVAGGVGCQIGQHQRRIGRFVEQQRFEQRIIEIGEGFEQVVALGLFAGAQFGGNFHLLARVAGAIAIGPLQREIDVAGDLFVAMAIAAAQRNLAQRQRLAAGWLQLGDQFVHGAGAGLLDLVDEDRVGQPKLVQLAQHRFSQRGAVGRRINHHHRHVDRAQRGQAVGAEPGGAGQVKQRQAIAKVGAVIEVEFGRAAAGAGFGAAVAQARSGLDAALAGGGATGEQQRFGQAGLARAGRPDQRDRTGSGSAAGVAVGGVAHCRLLFGRGAPGA